MTHYTDWLPTSREGQLAMADDLRAAGIGINSIRNKRCPNNGVSAYAVDIKILDGGKDHKEFPNEKK